MLAVTGRVQAALAVPSSPVVYAQRLQPASEPDLLDVSSTDGATDAAQGHEVTPLVDPLLVRNAADFDGDDAASYHHRCDQGEGAFRGHNENGSAGFMVYPNRGCTSGWAETDLNQ